MNALLDRARELFDGATALPRELREEYVRRSTLEDPELFEVVMQLLRYDDQPTTQGGGAGGAGSGGGTPSLVPGYTLRQRQANWYGGELWQAEPEAGGSRVFVALQPRPDSIRAALVRWRLMRPQLSGISDVHVARILDAGRTSDDRLYLIMPAFLPLSLQDWLTHHNPSPERMLSVVRQLDVAMTGMAAMALAHGSFGAEAIRLRGATDRGPEVQIIGLGMQQTLGTHLGKGQALTIDGDRQGLAQIARIMLWHLMQQSASGAAEVAGGSGAAGATGGAPADVGTRGDVTPAPATLGPALMADPSVKVLLRVAETPRRAPDSIDGTMVPPPMPSGRSMTWLVAASAAAAGVLAAVPVLLFGLVFPERPVMQPWMVAVAAACSGGLVAGIAVFMAARCLLQSHKDSFIAARTTSSSGTRLIRGG